MSLFRSSGRKSGDWVQVSCVDWSTVLTPTFDTEKTHTFGVGGRRVAMAGINTHHACFVLKKSEDWIQVSRVKWSTYPDFRHGKKNRGEFKTPPRPTGRRSNYANCNKTEITMYLANIGPDRDGLDPSLFIHIGHNSTQLLSAMIPSINARWVNMYCMPHSNTSTSLHGYLKS